MDFDAESLFDPSWDEETRHLRGTLWPVVNWLMPIRLEPAAEGEADYLALKPQLLPRVPVAGDWVEVPGYWARVERLSWGADGRVLARLQEARVEPGVIDDLDRAGWQTFPRQDADEWLRRLDQQE